MTIECPECGYGWGEEAYEDYKALKKAFGNRFYCVGMGLRVDPSKRQSNVEQARKTLEKRVR